MSSKVSIDGSSDTVVLALVLMVIGPNGKDGSIAKEGVIMDKASSVHNNGIDLSSLDE